jgi:hypothetical protein
LEYCFSEVIVKRAISICSDGRAALLAFDDLNVVVDGYADCYSKSLGFEFRVSHGRFQKV